MKAFLFLLNSRCNVSLEKTAQFVSDITGGILAPSVGMISGLCREFSLKSRQEQDALFKSLLDAPVMHVDGTVARVNGNNNNVVVCSNGTATMYFAREHKGHAGIKATPVENFGGILIHDHEACFYSYGSDHQECLVHIERYLRDSMENEKHLTWNRKMLELIRGTGASANYSSTTTGRAPWQGNDNEHTWVILEEGCTWLAWTCALSSNYLEETKKWCHYSVQLLVLPESLDIGTGEEFSQGIGCEDVYYKLANGEVVYADPAYENIDFGDKLTVWTYDEGSWWLDAQDDGTYWTVYSDNYNGDKSDTSKSIIELGGFYGSSNDSLIFYCQDIPVVEYAGVQYTGEEFGELWSRKLEEYRGFGYLGD